MNHLTRSRNSRPEMNTCMTSRVGETKNRRTRENGIVKEIRKQGSQAGKHVYSPPDADVFQSTGFKASGVNFENIILRSIAIDMVA
jgi:hypothetical protein